MRILTGPGTVKIIFSKTYQSIWWANVEVWGFLPAWAIWGQMYSQLPFRKWFPQHHYSTTRTRVGVWKKNGLIANDLFCVCYGNLIPSEMQIFQFVHLFCYQLMIFLFAISLYQVRRQLYTGNITALETTYFSQSVITKTESLSIFYFCYYFNVWKIFWRFSMEKKKQILYFIHLYVVFIYI